MKKQEERGRERKPWETGENTEKDSKESIVCENKMKDSKMKQKEAKLSKREKKEQNVQQIFF